MNKQELLNIDKNNFIVVKTNISDKFDLPLAEAIDDNTYYTIPEIKQETEKRINRMSALGVYYTIPTEYIVKYEIINTKNIIAQVEPVGEHAYIVRFSKAVINKRNEKYLDTIIYHELCHILQIECLVNIGIMSFLNGELGYDSSKKPWVDAWFYKDDYHTNIWYTFVNKVNSTFNIMPPVDRFLDAQALIETFLEDTFKADKFIPVDIKITDIFKI